MFKRKDSLAAADTPDEGSAVQAARTRARRRLIGAALLVGIGIVGFPLLFETQPRPIAVDIPIEIPSREDAPALKLPASKPGAVAPVEPPASAGAPAPTVAASAAAPAQVAAPAPSASAAGSRAEREAEAVAPPAPPAPSRAATEPPRGASEPQRAAPRPSTEPQRDAQRAQAILDGKPLVAAAPPASAAAGKSNRFVVQAGAYTDAGTLREARQKVERLGLKTYTQVIESDAGRRTRVRVGPFESRDEAEKAAARIKSAGLAASILSL